MKLFKLRRSDKGDSELLSFMIIFPLLMFMILFLVDFSMYSMNRSTIESNARDAARTVAIMGGNGTPGNPTVLEATYGDSTACQDAGIGGGYTNTECTVWENLGDAGLVNTEITNVKCSPVMTKAVGQPVSCTVTWNYSGYTGFIGNGDQQTQGTSLSEVNLLGAGG